MPKDYSYGVIPFFVNTNKTIEYLLVKHQAGHWGLPKGHKEDGEDDLTAAKREFTEETNVTEYNILKPNPFICESYIAFHPVHKQVAKTVCYYIGHVFSKDIQAQKGEIGEVGWFTYTEAYNVLSHQEVKDVLQSADAEIRATYAKA